MRFVLICLLAQLVFTNPLFATEIRGEPEALRKFLHPHKSRVTLNAQVERRVYADQAIVSVLVKNDDKTLANAMQENARLRETLKTSLVSSAVSTDDIKNSQFSSSPQYGWFGDKPKSFEVINRVVVTINSEQALQALASVTDKFDEMSIVGTEFKHTTKDEVHGELKKEAMKKILIDKAYYENSLQVELKTVSFHDSGLIDGPTDGEVALEAIMVTGLKSKQSATSSNAYNDRNASNGQQSFEEIKYTINLRVDFEVFEREKIE